MRKVTRNIKNVNKQKTSFELSENHNFKMSSACPQAAKSLFAESKRRLSDRVAVNVNNCASVARQIVRGKNKRGMSNQMNISNSNSSIQDLSLTTS